MDKNTTTIGHIAALLTVIVWGTTFISTKVLLSAFQPVEILFFRFVMGFLALCLIYPHRLKGTSRSEELVFAAAGLCGICLYYLLENISLLYTLTSNASVIISIAPFFTALIAFALSKGESRLRWQFFLGFFVSMAGIILISFNGAKLEVNPFGDFLALLAAFVWACYSTLTKKIATFGYNLVQTTRRVFMYGIIFMLPVMFLFDFNWDITRFANPVYLFNILFLGLGASAICFLSWNYAVGILGPVMTTIYIYLMPVATIVTSVIVLDEPVTFMSAAGTVLAIAGLVISQLGGKAEGKSA